MERLVLALTVGAVGSSALASGPTLGGPMSHLLVTVFDQRVFIGFESPGLSTVTMQRAGDDFDGAASVLNHTSYNAQFGWLANGFISLPPSSGVFVRTVSSSVHLRVYGQDSFAPILGTDGSSDVWQWDGRMTHNWYSSDVVGPHRAVYEVFVGDALGNPLDGWVSGLVEINFEPYRDLPGSVRVLDGASFGLVPAPGALGVLGIGALIGVRRRR
jgi:hypothetical protein